MFELDAQNDDNKHRQAFYYHPLNIRQNVYSDKIILDQSLGSIVCFNSNISFRKDKLLNKYKLSYSSTIFEDNFKKYKNKNKNISYYKLYKEYFSKDFKPYGLHISL